MKGFLLLNINMFARGSGSGLEYKRVDNAFYKGVVVDNNDPSKLNRVKVYIPELTNQPFDSWIDEYDSININSIGENIKSKWNEKETNGDWSDVSIFDDICENIPWAEQCFPLFGESGNFRYYKDGEIATISDCNYIEGFQTNDSDPITLKNGSFSPSFIYENVGTRLGDAFNKPLDNFTVNANPYSFQYAPSNNVNKSKGVFGIPEVGAKVWVFHYEGDLNFPIYFGVVGKSYRELSLINNTDNDKSIGIKYPNGF
jgi:hypothetical protein